MMNVNNTGKDNELAVRKVILGSAGETARYCPALVQPKVDKIALGCLENLFIVSEEFDAENLFDSCCNNAAWAIGELALAFPNELMNYITQFATKLSEVLASEETQVYHLLSAPILMILIRKIQGWPRIYQ